jgi:hypothetical protein
MEPITAVALQQFLKKLGEQFTHPAKFYLLGGSALCLLGSPRETLDVDYSLEPASISEGGGKGEIEQILKQLSSELRLDLELVPLAEFIPLPPNAEKRHRFLGRYGQVDVYIYDLYSIALSKIARGFEADLEDVEYLLDQHLITWDELEGHFNSILPQAKNADINPKEFETYFKTLKKRLLKN